MLEVVTFCVDAYVNGQMSHIQIHEGVNLGLLETTLSARTSNGVLKAIVLEGTRLIK